MANFEALVPPTIKNTVSRWIEEDLPAMDIGGFVVADRKETAFLYCKSACVLAGQPYAQAVFDYFGDLDVSWRYPDGAALEGSGSNKVIVAVVSGPCRQVLMAERTALNVLSRASGVATAARKAKDIADANGWTGMVAGTRKTTRVSEEWKSMGWWWGALPRIAWI